jgi:hypothetical protein
MEKDLERTEVMRIEGHPSPAQIMIKNNWRM